MRESTNTNIAEHYNRIKSLGGEKRSSSRIIGVRQVNNFLKHRLIHKFIQENAVVLDLGCGKGGDLSKLRHYKIKRYYGCDIAGESLKEALERSMSHTFKIDFLQADFTSKKIIIEMKANLVMAQFSFHYAFINELSVHRAVMNIDNNLESGGIFIMTVPDKDVITRRSACNPHDGSFGNAYYKVKPTQSFNRKEIFGRGYNFYLEEALMGCEEYLTDIDYLTKIFKERGIEKVFDCDFLSFLNKEMHIDKSTYETMVTHKLKPEEVPIVELYRAVAYKKVV